MKLGAMHYMAALSAIFFSLAVSAQNTGEKKPGINPEEKQRVKRNLVENAIRTMNLWYLYLKIIWISLSYNIQML